MTRLYAVALLACAMAATGCSTLGRGGNLPSHLSSSRHAPRPGMQRAGYAPNTGLANLPAVQGNSRGQGMIGDGPGLVQRCVHGVMDCPGGCGVACDDGSCYGGQCGPGGCPNGCTCGGTGQCQVCCKLRAMAGAAVNGVVDPGRYQNDGAYNFNAGPATGQVAYPYYTTRGPRDFLSCNPPSIGPY